MGKDIAEEEDDELSDLLDEFDDADEEELGVDDTDEFGLGEIEDAPEDVGLDVETLEGSDATLGGLDDEGDEDAESALDDATLDIDGDLDDDDDDEGGWTTESEGAGSAFEDELLEDDDDTDRDDGGLEGVDDPLIDAIDDDDEERPTSIVIDSNDDEDEEDEALDRLELDLG